MKLSPEIKNSICVIILKELIYDIKQDYPTLKIVVHPSESTKANLYISNGYITIHAELRNHGSNIMEFTHTISYSEHHATKHGSMVVDIKNLKSLIAIRERLSELLKEFDVNTQKENIR